MFRAPLDIESFITDSYPAWTAGMRSLPCRVPQTAIAGTFSTTWDTLSQNIFNAGTGTSRRPWVPTSMSWTSR